MIARVYVDVPVPQLDHLFDYLIPAELQDQAKPGIRVKVPFSGRQLSGYIVELVDSSDRDKLLPITKIVSKEVVLPPASVELFRSVADHCAGTFADVARLAIPPRVSRVEKASTTWMEPQVIQEPCSLDLYPQGTNLRQAFRAGKTPRVAWTLAPVANQVGDWANGLAGLVADTVANHRRVLVLVPDEADCTRVLTTIKAVINPEAVVCLSAEKGLSARYAAFLAATRGQAWVVVGNRSAAYTPLPDLGLIAIWDESDAAFTERHYPYPSLRDIIAIRSSQTKTGVVFAGYSRSTSIQQWVKKSWLGEIGFDAQAHKATSVMRIASQDERSLDRDKMAHSSRIPHDVFSVITAGLARGPVLVWVPWLGGRRNFICRRCGLAMRCDCSGSFAETQAGVVICGICGRQDWTCACGSTGWRAVTIGSARTAEELAAAFPKVPVLKSDSTGKIEQIEPDPAIIIATPGCEPHCDGGYAAAVVLDGKAFLSRPDLWAGEEAVRRWLNLTALVRSRRDGGTVLIVGPSQDRAVQAVVRLDAAGFADRELADREEAGFPPARRMAIFTGSQQEVDEVAQQLSKAGYIDLLGPIPGDETRLIARSAVGRGEDFARLLTKLAIDRAQSNRGSKLTWRLDMDWQSE